MTARYDLYESPNPDNNTGKRNIHARLVTDGTVNSEEIAEKIEYSSTLTIGDVKAVLSALSHHVSELLSQGKRVHLEGLGYFQMTLSCPPVKTIKEVKGDQITCKSVAFRPEKTLKNKLQATKFLRSEKRNIHSPKHKEKKILALLNEHFKEHHYITRAGFEKLSGFTKTTANSHLARLVESDILKKEGFPHHPFYELIRK